MPRITRKDYLDVVEIACEAALEPAMWDPLLRRLAGLTGCVAGGLTYEDPSVGQGHPLVFFGFDPDHVERTFDHYLPMNPLFGICERMRPGYVVTNEMVVAPSEFRASEFYDGWARPQGLCSPLTLVLHRDGAAYSPLTLVRPDGADGASDEHCALMSKLAPHLIRAFRTGLRLEQLKADAESLERSLSHLDVAVMLLDATGRVVFQNAAAEELIVGSGAFRVAMDGRLGATHAQSNADLHAAVRRTVRDDEGFAAELKIERRDGRPLSATVHALSVGQRAMPVMRPATHMLIVRDVDRANGEAAAARTARLYELTLAEERVLAALMSGAGLTRAAEQIGVSRATAHSHLKAIFDKTETRRQGELIALALSSS